MYDGMRRDMMVEDKPTEKKPVVEQKPVQQQQQQPQQKPVVENKPTTEQKPVSTDDNKPVVADKLTDKQFIEKFGKRTVTTEELRQNGFDARNADVNGDGAISGAEWSNAFRAVDKLDANKDKKSVNPADAKGSTRSTPRRTESRRIRRTTSSK